MLLSDTIPLPQLDPLHAVAWGTVAGLFEQMAERYSSRIALVCGQTRLTYRELNVRANAVAHRLIALGVGSEVAVGVCLPRSIASIVAILGVLKAGGAFVPLDPEYPRERIGFMLASAGAKTMVTQRHLAQTPLGGIDSPTLLLDGDGSLDDLGLPRDLPQDEASSQQANPVRRDSPADLAYVMYTSGSTGRPKGVMVENRSIVRLVSDQDYCVFGDEEVFLHAAPGSFDASTFEIWGALLHGARLVIPAAKTLSLDDLAACIREHGVTTMWLTSGLFNVFVNEHLDDLAGVRQLLVGGDIVSAGHVRRVLERFPAITVINGYGPTENTTFTCCHPMRRMEDVTDVVSIGRPIAHTTVYLLDEAQQPVMRGKIGELYTGGAGVARGYASAPQATDRAFLRDPFVASASARMYRTGDMARYREDGTIEFLGRNDDQMKVNGFRIELGEIESAMLEHPEVSQACALAMDTERSTRRLVACFVTRSGRGVTAKALRSFLAAKLPAYLLPSAMRPIESIPLTPNGKVDRVGLARRWQTEGKEGAERNAGL